MEYLPSTWNDSLKQTFCLIDSSKGNLIYYFFDAIVRVEHNQELVITKHPVQDMASISDHAYLLPANIAMDIIMSDTVAIYSTESITYNPYTGDKSKSRAADVAFRKLQSERTILTLQTRLRTYNNILLQSIRPIEDNKTVASLHSTLVFEQIIMGASSMPPKVAPAQEHAINYTEMGSLAPNPISKSKWDAFLAGQGDFPLEIPFL